MSASTPMILERNETGRFGRKNRASAAAGIALVGGGGAGGMLAGADAAAGPRWSPARPRSPPPRCRPYHIQVGDVLEVRLLLNPELNEEVTVRPDGHISTTAVQDMLAYGRTPADLAEFVTIGLCPRPAESAGFGGGQVVRTDPCLCRWRSEYAG